MKRKYIYILMGCLTFIGIASYGFYKLFADYAVYEITKEGWKEVYRSISHDKAMNEFRRLKESNKEKKTYIYVDEYYGNSIIP